MEAAKVILEYLRVLVWPAVVVSVLIGFSPDVREAIKRVSKVGSPLVSAEFATGQAGSEEAPVGAPDVWFDIQETSLHRGDCMNRAQRALDKSGFQHIRRGVVTYGYMDRFVGAVWCGWREGLVLITVAGPKEQDLQAQYEKLANAFSGADL